MRAHDFFYGRMKMGMRAILFGVGVSLVGVSAANAADFTSRGSLKDAPFVEVQCIWCGFYGGFSVGYGSGVAKNYVSPNANAPHGWANNDPS
ncbi:MAG TPA: hypothetical protein VNR65_01030, partial [Geobacterales bacterium]|nr:hypothetical protein [Geobacterales bacterium]